MSQSGRTSVRDGSKIILDSVKLEVLFVIGILTDIMVVFLAVTDQISESIALTVPSITSFIGCITLITLAKKFVILRIMLVYGHV